MQKFYLCYLMIFFLSLTGISFAQPRVHRGFTAKATVHLSFNDDPLYEGTGSSRTVGATVSISVSTTGIKSPLDPTPSWGVTISGPGTVNPSTVSFVYGSSYSQGIQITIPAAVGSYDYTASLSNMDGTTSTDTATAIIQDTTPPTITPPADCMVKAYDANASIGVATATDICDPSPVIDHDPKAPFSPGVQVIVWTATDASGNIATATQTVTAYDISLVVEKDCIAAGKINSAAHRTLVTATVTPPELTGNVIFSLVGGNGVSGQCAAFDNTSVALTSGVATTTLTSSNKVEKATIVATFISASTATPISFSGGVESWTIDPDSLPNDGSSTATLTLQLAMFDGSLIDQHNLQWSIIKIEDETTGTMLDLDSLPIVDNIHDDHGNLLFDYGAITVGTNPTDTAGKGTSTYRVGSVDHNVTITFQALDQNVYVEK